MSAEVDNLENLNNAELRAKCKEYGLPNVPITDSSRSVLIKKLRASMTGSPATQKVKSNRRETIHASKNIEVSVSKESNATKEEGSRTPSRGANRRTIAGTPTFESRSNERALVTETAAPINARRRSVREQEQTQPLQPSQQQKSRSVVTDVRSTIIIESDEEDEDDLVKAAVQAEQLSVPTAAGAGRSRTSRSVSLSKTGVLTTSYSQATIVPPRIVEEEEVVQAPKLSSYVSNTVTAPTVTGLYPNLSQSGVRNFMTEPVPIAERRIPSYTQSSRYTMDATTTRFAGGVSQEPNRYYSPSTRYSTGAATATAAATLRAKASALYNEQSDDTDANAEEDFQTPYLSSFTRNLKRLKTDALGRSGANAVDGYYSDTLRYKHGGTHNITGRRPTNNSVRESLRHLLITLDRKYNLKLYICMFGIFVLLVFLYVLFFQ